MKFLKKKIPTTFKCLTNEYGILKLNIRLNNCLPTRPTVELSSNCDEMIMWIERQIPKGNNLS